MKQEHKEVFELAALAGRIMLESHAESYRVEDTVIHILRTTGLSQTECISYTTGLYITLDDDKLDSPPMTMVIRVSKRGNHMNKIYRVNNISRQFTAGKITVAEARDRLEVVDESEYSNSLIDLATVLLVMAFVILLGGNLWEILISIIPGIIVAGARLTKSYLGMNDFINGAFVTMITSIITNALVNFFPIQGLSADIIIIAALMPLYPGTAFMNALRDTLKGDYTSGIARMLDAFVIALSLALGVAVGLFIYGRLV